MCEGSHASMVRSICLPLTNESGTCYTPVLQTSIARRINFMNWISRAFPHYCRPISSKPAIRCNNWTMAFTGSVSRVTGSIDSSSHESHHCCFEEWYPRAVVKLFAYRLGQIIVRLICSAFLSVIIEWYHRQPRHVGPGSNISPANGGHILAKQHRDGFPFGTLSQWLTLLGVIEVIL